MSIAKRRITAIIFEREEAAYKAGSGEQWALTAYRGDKDTGIMAYADETARLVLVELSKVEEGHDNG